VLTPTLTAIELRRFVEVSRDPLETGQKNHHVVAQALPQGHDHHGRKRQQGIGEETNRLKTGTQERAEPSVDQAVLGVEPTKGNRRHNDRDQHRRVEGGPKPVDPRQLTIHEDRQRQRPQNHRRHHSKEIRQGRPQDLEEHRIRQQAPHIRQAHKAQGLRHVQAGLGEAHHQGHRRRDEHRQGNQHQRRGQESPGGGRGGTGAEGTLSHIAPLWWIFSDQPVAPC